MKDFIKGTEQGNRLSRFSDAQQRLTLAADAFGKSDVRERDDIFRALALLSVSPTSAAMLAARLLDAAVRFSDICE
jgi:hypothetical protein